jgi:hypothetical protein
MVEETGMTSHLANYPNQPASSGEMLDALQRDAFGYFLHETNPANGLVVDKTQPDAPASIAAVGFALAVYPVGVERSWMRGRRGRNSPAIKLPGYRATPHLRLKLTLRSIVW